GDWRARAAYDAYRLGAGVARALPGPVADLTARGASAVLLPAMRGRRDMVARHQRRVRGGQLGPLAVRRAVRATFDSYARYWLEAFRLPDASPDALAAGMTVEGFEHIEEGVAAGNGVILALPHLGGWEWAGAWVARCKGLKLAAVVEPLEPPALFEWFVGLRSDLGMSIIPLGDGAGGAVLRALHGNEVLCLLCDRDIGGGGVEVEFFGETTTLPAGPATLALRTGAPLLPTAAYFGRGRNAHHGVIRPPLPVERGSGRLRDDVVRITQALAHELEVLIRRAPEQWHLLQPNWPTDNQA
ncbi:MAG: putative acyltransferase, partial [Acidimicrobiales bacterium]|nr:putative acyltransferase [Acidimicrobiales bacterium]